MFKYIYLDILNITIVIKFDVAVLVGDKLIIDESQLYTPPLITDEVSDDHPLSLSRVRTHYLEQDHLF